MIVLLSHAAERQLRALPPPAARKVLRALPVLALVPLSGRIEDSNSPYAGMISKVVRIRRGWSYRIIYEISERWIKIHDVAPTWSGPR